MSGVGDCLRGHAWLPVLPELLVCECSATGRLANQMGAVDLVRRLIERQGGFDSLRQKLAGDQATSSQAKADKAARLRKGWHRQGGYSAKTFRAIPGSETRHGQQQETTPMA